MCFRDRMVGSFLQLTNKLFQTFRQRRSTVQLFMHQIVQDTT